LTAWEYLGWLGNACFFLRIGLVWLHAERTRTSDARAIVWILSLMGSMLLATYAFGRGVPILLTGYLINGLIYSRNLRIQSGKARRIPYRWTLALGGTALAILVASGVADRGFRPEEGLAWIVCAIAGQALWSSRFVVQWWISEARETSHFPPAFWAVGLVGNLLLLSYALHLWDAVFIAGLAAGPVIQSRNLFLSRAAEVNSRRAREEERKIESSPA
jgi:lipid-A-disaccharide synthase-like uncharacterized protein